MSAITWNISSPPLFVVYVAANDGWVESVHLFISSVHIFNFMLWLRGANAHVRFRPKPIGKGEEKIMFWIKIPALVAKNTAGDEVVLRSGKNTTFSITNVKI